MPTHSRKTNTQGGLGKGGVLMAALSALAGCMNTVKSTTWSHQYLSGRPQGGDLVYQARLARFDYRFHLRRALAGDEQSLGQLMAYTVNGAPTGEAAISHCEVLRRLMIHFGDEDFARVLRDQSPGIRSDVIGFIEEDGRFSARDRIDFPLTFGIGSTR